jgi:hypothetical protein
MLQRQGGAHIHACSWQASARHREVDVTRAGGLDPGMVTEAPIDPDDETVIRTILAHPAFPDAFRHVTRRFLDIHVGPHVTKLLANEARFHIAQFSLALHGEKQVGLSDTGITAARLLERCVSRGIISRGRLDATVLTLRRAGWLVDLPLGRDRRMKQLEPGAVLVANFTDRLAFHLEALEMVMPGVGHAARLRDDPLFFWAWEAERGRVLSGAPTLRLRVPGLAALAGREGAYPVMVDLMDQADRLAGSPPSLPPPGVLPFTLAAQARRQGIARSQLGRILEDMVSHGMVTPLPADQQALRLEPLAVETMRLWYAIRLARFHFFAERGLRHLRRAAA